MADAGNWCLIESDPGVFTELIKDFGVQGIQVEELWSLDPEQFESLKPVHGLIFLFKWQPNEETSGTFVQDARLEKIFFAKQIISNACATQALISILMNCKNPDLDLGPTLREFRDFVQCFDPNMKGLALSNSDIIRSVHNSFAKQSVFEYQTQVDSKDEDVFHFTGYIPIDGRLYELDGLKEAPMDLGPISGDNWLETVKPIIEKRIQRYTEGEIHFNLMAVVSDRKILYERELAQLEAKEKNAQVEAEISRLRQLLENEEHKRSRQMAENSRRKHNYIPFIVRLLQILANKDKLIPLYENAKQKALARCKNKSKPANS
nr:EOG090X0A33 [Lepidurus arcticus]